MLYFKSALEASGQAAFEIEPVTMDQVANVVPARYAFVVLSDGVRLEAGRVKAHVHANLAKFSAPRDVVFVERLPRNAAGKVLKHQLHLH